MGRRRATLLLHGKQPFRYGRLIQIARLDITTSRPAVPARTAAGSLCQRGMARKQANPQRKRGAADLAPAAPAHDGQSSDGENAGDSDYDERSKVFGAKRARLGAASGTQTAAPLQGATTEHHLRVWEEIDDASFYPIVEIGFDCQKEVDLSALSRCKATKTAKSGGGAFLQLEVGDQPLVRPRYLLS